MVPKKSGILSPQLPKPLPAGSLSALSDHTDTSGVALSGLDFSNQAALDVLFDQVLLQHCIFQQTRLERPRLFDVRTSGSDFSGAVWDLARLRRVEFNACRLLGIQLLKANLEQAFFKECNLGGALFASAVFRNARFEGCSLKGASFEGADLSGVIFRHCDLSEAIFSGAKMDAADLRGSLLNGMKLGAQDIKGVIIDSTQAIQVVALLGVVIQDLDPLL
jgi:uncharacterized protein YjbI with pentapeptide repeats